MSDDLLAFLRVRLDDDERIARESASEPYCFYADGHCGAVVEFLGRWNPVDPAQVLREVEAKRRIVAGFMSAANWADTLRADGENSAAEPYARHAGSLLEVIRELATVYADDPDFREEWRP